MNDTPKDNVLIVRFSALGDVSMTIPVVYGVCRKHPERRFVFVTKKSVTGIFVNPPANLSIFSADTTARHKGFKGIWRLYRDLREEKFGYVIDLHDVLRSRILGLLWRMCGARCFTLDKGRKEKRQLCAPDKKSALKPLKGSIERYADVFRKAGFEIATEFCSIFDGNHPAQPLPTDIEPRRDGELWMGIAPFAKHQGKIYPIHRTEELVKYLSEQKRYRIFLMGGGSTETPILQAWAEKYPGVVSLAGKRLGFPAELSLISRMDMVVSMDSANMHLASLVGVPVISIWGQTHPYAGFLGWNQASENIVQCDLPCRPCSIFGNRPCRRGDYACMEQIPLSVIIKRIESLS